MRLGISSGLIHSSPTQWAQQMADLKLKSVVFPLDYTTPAEVVDAYVKEAREKDLVIAEVGIWRNALAADPKQRQEAMDRSIGQLKMADRIGAKCCVNVVGSMGQVWDGPYKENFSKKAWDASVRMIQEVIDEAKPVNTYFSIESMPWMYPSGPEEYDRLIETVNRERFGVHLDAINMITSPQRYFFMEEFLEQCFHILGDKILSCHLKDIHMISNYTFHVQECACGEGEFPIEKLVQLIDSTDPQMPLIIEHLNSDEAYRNSVAYVQKRLGL